MHASDATIIGCLNFNYMYIYCSIMLATKFLHKDLVACITQVIVLYTHIMHNANQQYFSCAFLQIAPLGLSALTNVNNLYFLLLCKETQCHFDVFHFLCMDARLFAVTTNGFL